MPSDFYTDWAGNDNISGYLLFLIKGKLQNCVSFLCVFNQMPNITINIITMSNSGNKLFLMKVNSLTKLDYESKIPIYHKLLRSENVEILFPVTLLKESTCLVECI